MTDLGFQPLEARFVGAMVFAVAVLLLSAGLFVAEALRIWRRR